jgi:hypothetical protein
LSNDLVVGPRGQGVYMMREWHNAENNVRSLNASDVNVPTVSWFIFLDFRSLSRDRRVHKEITWLGQYRKINQK